MVPAETDDLCEQRLSSKTCFVNKEHILNFRVMAVRDSKL